ncbi:hypothetical protein Atai01_41240 [Amycolatopsis taiwanensis]|uniref:Uncharacterized protein n=1 Tax=Amycolatopsis taiwanensis TaxID=342230 RepID=A0A9W6VG76_9PSEU|nr:hypothetical protein Atai01_41240 [Amycolatopsis taiwanensis]
MRVRDERLPGAAGTDRSGGYAIGTGDPMSSRRELRRADSLRECATPHSGRSGREINPFG